MDSSSASSLVLFVFAASVLIYGAVLYRGLVRVRDQNDRLLARLDALLRQRNQQIPELVTLVQNELPTEQQKLLTQAHEAWANAVTLSQKAAADLHLTDALQKFLEFAEKNSRLASSEPYFNLRNQLAGLQTQIAEHRTLFNEDVRQYNARIGQVPEAFVASIMGMTRRERFEASRKQ
ncbi:MAG: LemA family protein [Candidatus Sulfotelmatobacter sp.]